MEAFNEWEMFRTVLNEILTELKQFNNGQKEMGKTLLLLGEKVDGFQQRLDNLKVEAPAVDLQPVKDQLAEWAVGFNRQMTEGMEKIQTAFSQNLQKLSEAVAAQPKPIVRRISLFPENDYNGHFKFFIGRLLWAILGLCLLAGLFSLGQQYIMHRSMEREAPRMEYVPEKIAPMAPPPRKAKTSRKHHEADSVEKAPVEGDSVGRLP